MWRIQLDFSMWSGFGFALHLSVDLMLQIRLYQKERKKASPFFFFSKIKN